MKERIKGAFTKRKIFHFLKMALLDVYKRQVLMCILTVGKEADCEMKQLEESLTIKSQG